ncbi:MAG: filamentous hemagglutinin N-terminal domain-containing protein, partial [Phycisphaeraceae bacterium]|nr:filamentous hemagglutinin N-terminal domain-containing protein [Phycisphaeraceae bacterium]
MTTNMRMVSTTNLKEQRRTRELKRRTWRTKVRGYFAGSSALLTALIGVNAYATPQGGVVAAGDANINQGGNLTTIDQFTNTAVIDWQGFDINAGETVQFNQPNAMSKVLNRIQSGSPTEIYGQLQANGIVYVINQAGVIVGSGGVVDTAGFVAAAASMTNDDFMNGVDHFTNVQGDVVNWGRIQTQSMAVLVGSHVANYGEIVAENGYVAMIAGDDVLLGESADGHIFAQINGAAANIDAARAGVRNEGIITADQVALGAGDLYSIAIYNSGDILAGDISLEGQGSGAILHTGVLDASNSLAMGGTVVLTGEKVA